MSDNAKERQLQLELPLRPVDETRLERVERIMGGQLGRVVRPASELAFDYDTATRVATEGTRCRP